MRTKHSRRAFLASTGTVLAATLAGCSGDTEGDTADGSKDSTTKDKASGSKDSTTASESTETSTSEQTTTTTKQEEKKALEIVEHDTYEGDYDSGVKGVVKNNGDKELPYVEVKAKFMDSEGTLLDSNFTNVNDLSPGQKWEFKIGYLGEDDFSDYQLEVSTGF